MREALKLAREHIDGNFTVSAGVALAAIDKALAQPEQEPVAWIDASSFAMMHQDPRFDRVQWQTTLTLSKVYEGQMPLYTTPPQRTWVGLTDEEIRKTCVNIHGGYEQARVIEAKLKEKNT